MAVLDQVELALLNVSAAPWQVEVARALAAVMDSEPNASVARELRLLMADLTRSDVSVADGDVSDDLAAKRAARRRAASA